jgi:hypothetical protein
MIAIKLLPDRELSQKSWHRFLPYLDEMAKAIDNIEELQRYEVYICD